MKKALLIEILKAPDYQAALKQGVELIVCQRSLVESPEIKVVMADDYRVEGSWLAYQYNQSIWQVMRSKSPNEWQIDGIDIAPMVPKKLYWSNHSIGAIYAAAEQFKSTHFFIDQIQYFPKNRIKQTLKWIMLQLKFFKEVLFHKYPKPIKIKGSIGVLLNSQFEFELYLPVLKYIKHKGLIVFHYGNIDANVLQEFTHTDISNIGQKLSFKFLKYFKWTSEELSAYNFIQSKWINSTNAIARIKFIHSTGIKVLLTNVAENLPLRNLMKPIFGKDIMLYNAMNGLKAGEAHDADVYFDYWFVWDTQLKQLLHQMCKIPLESLIEVGHLSQDLIANYVNKQTYKSFLDTHQGKRVISIFSVRGERQEKTEVLNWMHHILATRQDVVFIIKPHPLEHDFKSINHPNMFVVPTEYGNQKQALYDQIFASEFVVVFGSTVAYESAWMQTKAYNFELRPKPFIQANAHILIEHINSTSSLDKALEQKPLIKLSINIESHVAFNMAKHMLSHVE